MKTNLTLKFSFLFVLLLATVNLSTAQTVFGVTVDGGTQTIYNIAPANNWGADLPDCLDNYDLSGEIVIVDDGDDEGGAGETTDGCQAIINGGDIAGKIALIDRGSCEFATKALNAQNAGAAAVLICNNVVDAIPNPLGGGVDSDDVTVPVWGLELADCNEFRAAVESSTSTVIGEVFWTGGLSTDNVLWGDLPGQGDFDGGLNGWTTVDISCANGGTTPLWVYDADADAVGGAFSTGGGVSTAITACNGAMVFDSDFYDNNGDEDNLGGGDCTAVQIGELISPAIDLSAIASDVSFISLKWHQATRQFTSNYFVSYSNDNGNTWFDIQVNDEMDVNSPHFNETRRVIMPDADLSSTEFRVRFRYQANYYYWIIDDVQIIEAESNNLQVNTNFYAIAPNALTPQSQLEGFSFLADISNIGAETQPNTILNINIADDGGTSVFSADLDYGDVVADTVVENIPFLDGIHTPSGDPGDVFTGTYSISSDSVDFDESNNSVSFEFGISDSTFAKEFAPDFGVRPADNSWMGANDPHSWAYGCAYHIVNGSEGAGGETVYFAASATFGIEALPEEQIIAAYLYEWSDLNGDGFFDIDERVRIAIASYETTGNEDASDLLTIPLEPFDPLNPAGETGKIDLKDNTTYLLVVEFDTGETGVDMEVAAADGWEYNAQVFRTDQSVFGDMPYRPSPVIGIGKPSDITFEPSSFANLVPSVRLNLTSDVIISVDELDQANIITVNPNPADEYVNLNMDFVNTQTQVTVNIVDVTGKTVMSNVYDNVSKETFTLNTNNLAVGTYFVNILAEEGVRTERMIVQR